jgi:hypothetical protein
MFLKSSRRKLFKKYDNSLFVVTKIFDHHPKNNDDKLVIENFSCHPKNSDDRMVNENFDHHTLSHFGCPHVAKRYDD